MEDKKAGVGPLNSTGKEYWRGLEELADTPEFRNFLHREFPEDASVWSDPISRRSFLKLMGASFALAGLSSCVRLPMQKIVPYVKTPEGVVPGRPMFFATAMTFAGYGYGLLAESHTGRPTKLEGNPDHPASLGAVDPFLQASILELYDPDRSQNITHRDQISTWSTFGAELTKQLEALAATGGEGLRVLTETVTSPTLEAQMRALLAKYPKARWHAYEPVGRDSAREGARLAFGRESAVRYDLSKARVVVTLDADFVSEEPGRLAYVRQFIDGRRIRKGRSEMNRLYAFESVFSNTGATADHRVIVKASQVELVARSLAKQLGIGVEAPEVPASAASVLKALVSDLKANAGSCVVVPGARQPAAVHALAYAVNEALGAIGKSVLVSDAIEAQPLTSIKELATDMDAGRVKALLILGGNPVYSAPVDLQFGDRLAKVPFSAHLSSYLDETSERCQWHIPQSHFLEAWSDVRAFDGTVSIVQPIIEPLYQTHNVHELVELALVGSAAKASYEIVQAHWKSERPSIDFDYNWKKWLNDGLVANTALPARSTSLRAELARELGAYKAPEGGGLEIVFRPDPTIWDGRFANNGWLQELPKPLTSLTWDNAAMISPATARRLDIATGDWLHLEYQGRKLKIPAWIQPGHPDDSVTVHLGYGRTRAGSVGNGTGFNAYALLTSEAPLFGAGLKVSKAGGKTELAAAQMHHSMEGRDLVRVRDISRVNEPAPRAHGEPKEQGEGKHEKELPASVYPNAPDKAKPTYAWAMVIDNNACMGCSACVIGCVAENNIPVVGKDQVIRGREMHWIRVDRYYNGSPENPQALFEPVTCMHCEKAPCEVVCPVAATVHDEEGINEMVYNRCVGTRYCSNNCPYKVRRFNFLQYANTRHETLKMLQNPDVSVRTRGVMEKCTYCIQRINGARIEAEKQGRLIREGDFQTACQQACPTQAIVFGNKLDPESAVSKLAEEPLHYGLLEDLGTRPRTTYLERVRNPNPEIG